MRIHATINERTLRRSFREKRIGRNGLTVIDRGLPAFGLKVSNSGRKTFFVRAERPVGGHKTILGSADEMTAAEASEKALAAIAAAKVECETGPLFADFAQEFMRRHGRRWKPSTRKGNRHLIDRYLVPFFGTMPVSEIARADVQRWFDSTSATPGNANRALPVLSVMMRQAELWDFRPRVLTRDGHQEGPEGGRGRPRPAVGAARTLAPARKTKAPLFRDFAARYRERRRHRWKPASLKTFDGYMRNRLMPAFGRVSMPSTMPASRLGSTRRAWTSPARPTAPSRRSAPCSLQPASGASWESTSPMPAPTSSRTRAGPWRAFSTATSSNASATSWMHTRPSIPST